MSEVNLKLHKIDVYRNSFCSQCKRKYPETILNLEGSIHHKTGIVCIDKKSCNRARRKLIKGKSLLPISRSRTHK